METATETAALRQVALFGPLDGMALEALARHLRRHTYAPGEMLFREGEPCAGVFVLTAGTVRIYKMSPGGRELTLHREQAPATIAEVPLVDGGPYPASVQAVSPAETLFLPRRDFLAVCERHPRVTLAALELFGRRLRGLLTLLEAVTFGGVRQRLARLLLRRSRDRKVVAGTQQELALELGTVREVVARNLNRFQAEGLVRIRRGGVEVLDAEGLRGEAALEL